MRLTALGAPAMRPVDPTRWSRVTSTPCGSSYLSKSASIEVLASTDALALRAPARGVFCCTSEQSEFEPHEREHREKEGHDGRTEQRTARSHPYRRSGARPVPRGSRGDRRVRHPRRRDPSGLRPAVRLQRVRHILVRHEQGAGHAAEGYAKATGKVGVCMATSGPGATNLVTPIANAYMDSTPDGGHHRPSAECVDRHRCLPRGRHLAASRCRSPSTTSSSPIRRRSPQTIAEAFHLAGTGRPGPVLVDISKDALQERAPIRLATARSTCLDTVR